MGPVNVFSFIQLSNFRVLCKSFIYTRDKSLPPLYYETYVVDVTLSTGYSLA